MGTFLEIFAPDFLLRNSVYISLIFGSVCPLVGVYLVLRRLLFMGVALPQVSSSGIALAFALQGWGILPHLHETIAERTLALLGATLCTLAAILLLALTARRGAGSIEARIGAAYVLAGAWSLLLLVRNPIGEHGLLDLLKGEIIAVSNADLLLTAAVFGAVLLGLLFFQKEFVLVSFDREMATTLKKNVLAWDTALFLLIGLTISLAVLSVGPLVTFGFLLLPPLTAHLFARNMRQLMALASAVGGLTSVAGFAIAYRWDLPVGPTDVALLGVLYGLAYAFRKILGKGVSQS